MDYKKEYELLQKKHEAMLLDIEDYKKETAVTALLMSRPKDIPSCLAHLDKWGIRFGEDTPYVIAALSSDKDFEPPPRSNLSTYKIISEHHRSLKNSIVDILGRRFDVRIVNMPGHIYCIIDITPYVNEQKKAVSMLEDGLSELNAAVNNELANVDISRVWYGAEGLPSAFDDCVNAYRIRGIMGKFAPGIIYYSDIASIPGRTLEIDSEFIAELRRKAFCGEYAEAIECLRKYVSWLLSEETEAVNVMLEIVFHQLKNCVIDIVSEMFVCGEHDCERLSLKRLRGMFTRIQSLDGLLEFFERYCESFAACCAKCEAGQLPLAERIRLYIDESYTDCDLNVNLIAMHFDRTPSYTGKVFRKQFGISILEYIQRKRIDAVKIHLGTNKTIKEIASITGFESSQNLIRIFKKLEGITPGSEN